MGTITDRDIVDEIIANNGHDPAEPGHPLWFVKIVEYYGPEGDKQWGCVLNIEVHQGLGDRYEVPSEYIQNPKVIWRRSE